MELVEQCFQVLAYVAVIGFLISGLDDLLFDTQFLVYLFRNRRRRPISLAQIKAVPEQWIALFVPAWLEGGIVNRMAEYATRVLLYEKYDIFIGVYPNDPETTECLDRVCAENPRIHKVVVPHPGPTSKADCLNWIYRAMRLNEIPGRLQYKLIALHDAEDVLHPLLLKVYNFFIPAHYDMGQVPVFALEHPFWTHWSANTYIDDFSELHTKDLFVRQSIGGLVPSAGVGTCFTRQAIDLLAAENAWEPFHTGNLTEDYEVGIRLKRAGFRTGVLAYPVERIARRRRRDGSFGPPKSISEWVAVREAFPVTFWKAVRQRTRWILGISFQTWEQAGWQGSLAMRYTLLRDRRAPLTHLLNMAGYLTLAYVLFQYAFAHSPWAGRFYLEPVLKGDSFLWKIVIIDTWLLVYRALQKFISVYATYNFKQACGSIPRTVIGNLINFTATVRALYLYLDSKLFHRPIVWHKTQHEFPAESELREYAKTIEDLLVEQGLVTRQQIFAALEQFPDNSAPLCLLRLGLLREDQFTQTWSRHSGLEEVHIDPDLLPTSLLLRFPEAQSIDWDALPIADQPDHVEVAFREPPARTPLISLGRLFGKPIQPALATPSSLAFARDHAYPRLLIPHAPLPSLSKRLRQSFPAQDRAFEDCLVAQQVSRQNFADLAVDRGLLPETQARSIWAEHLGLPPADLSHPNLDSTLYAAAGPAFWWLHQLLPLQNHVILAGAPVAPPVANWLQTKFEHAFQFQAELPARLELLALRFGVALDPDALLLDRLLHTGALPQTELAQVQSSRALIKTPLAELLLLEKRVHETALHQVFLDIAHLPEAWNPAPNSIQALLPSLPPESLDRPSAFCLDTDDGIRIGLAQWPSRDSWHRLRQRYDGYPIFFQTLALDQVRALRKLAKRHST